MRRNTQRLYESIMKVVDRSVRKALNEQISQKDMAEWANEVGEPYTSDELDDYDSIFTDETFKYIGDTGNLPAKYKNINLDKYINRLSEDICDLKRFIPDIDLYTYDSITKIKHYIDDNLSENDLIIINKLDEKYKTIDGFPLLQKRCSW